ncbi:MAG: polyphenol oxidase family protein [Gemmatimonadota bacterium]
MREPRSDIGGLPLFRVPAWRTAFAWLLHGTTGRGDDESDPLDFGLFGAGPVGRAMERWRALRQATGFRTAVHSLQVHGADLLEHGDPGPGLLVAEGRDGHVTGTPGILLTVSLADCVPVSLVDPVRRRVALLHGGWRGTAAGIVGRGLEALDTDPARVHAHLGPAICGRCYEVGPEVHEALGLPVPTGPAPVDIRAVQAHQLTEAGVPARHVRVSEHCTLCGDGFFSHRGGSPGRHLAILGLR